MSTEQPTTEEAESSTDTTIDSATCAVCESPLERGSQHVSNNRTTVLYTCPDCRVGAVATVQQSGAPSDRIVDRLEHAQSNAVTGLSCYRVAAFITEDCPDGEYTIERTADHEFVIDLPAAASEWAVLRLADRLAIGPLSTDRVGGRIIVTDARWSHADEQRVADGGLTQTRFQDGAVTDPEDDPFAVATDDEPRTKRAKREDMDVAFLAKPGQYEVHAASGNCYEVDVVDETCDCPDFQRACSDPNCDVDRCKHLRRVDLEIRAGRVPRPDGKLPDG